MTDWISVNDMLPEKAAKVLVATKSSGGTIICLAYHMGEDGWYYIGWEIARDAVTHWMPLPEPPEL